MIRVFDMVFSFMGLLILCPLFLVISICLALEDRGGIFYLQWRVGKDNKDFCLYKFRSMRKNSDKSGLLTVGNDQRITKVGHWIRKYKIDELPQLYNVLKGDMSLVGPRPEVRKYVNLYTQEQRKVLDVRPGITDYASIYYVDENRLLGLSSDPDKTYIEEIMADKIKWNYKFIEHPSLGNYFKIIFFTLLKILR